MKFYNPFKPHIATYQNGFVIRKFNILYQSWCYLDKDHRHWWRAHVSTVSNCLFSSSDLAKHTFAKMYPSTRIKATYYATL